jgi:hypothetical protein
VLEGRCVLTTPAQRKRAAQTISLTFCIAPRAENAAEPLASTANVPILKPAYRSDFEAGIVGQFRGQFGAEAAETGSLPGRAVSI